METSRHVIVWCLIGSVLAWLVGATILVKSHGSPDLPVQLAILFVVMIAATAACWRDGNMLAFVLAGTFVGWLLTSLSLTNTTKDWLSRMARLSSDPWDFFADVTYLTGGTFLGSLIAALVHSRNEAPVDSPTDFRSG